MSPLVARHPSVTGSDEHIVRVMLILTATFASISVLSTLFALYWFVKMKRSFRHELILLLIQSDFAKSMVLVIFAIVSFVGGTIPSDSAFCQASGFVLAVGIESSDIAVLLIALHSAMYIFRPRAGLYPYRRRAYLVFYLYPTLAACLAFIGGNGYENMGPHCYLRTDRSWARLLLSWIPRYIICISIVIIYVSIYLYIRRRMGDYGRRCSEAMQSQAPRRSTVAASTPRLRYNGLLPSTPCSRRSSATDTILTAKDQLRPPSSIGSPWPTSARTSVDVQRPHNSVKWNWPAFTHTQSAEGSRVSGDDTSDPTSPTSPTFLTPPAAAHIPRPSLMPSADINMDISHNNINHNNNRNSNGRVSFHHHRRQPTPESDADADADADADSSDLPDSSPILSPTRGSSGRTSGVGTSPFITITSPDSSSTTPPTQPRSHQKKTLRQLRLLFAYPLVYIILWLFPFVAHVLGYDDSSSSTTPLSHPSHWLLVVSILSLCVQGAVDCLLFLLRETPWRYARGRGFWVVLGKRWAWRTGGSWWCWWWWWGGGSGGMGVGLHGDGVGRTREEMLVYGRLARERREGEVAVERVRGRERGVAMAAGREWWDGWVEREGWSDDDDVDVDDVDEEGRGGGEGGEARQRMA
ncbi:G protein-coupled glucose receptor regulating Gpa2-domain-containing protein [Chaetomium tenue]|uniref:G protein-coupled glucose receptor regulating Gpa2-domain-containing protein n=1 Tax=Chaetomium tenue TaxID=1854479 RepID=A0ACB7P7K8_9PEZI|nr:G protein-coupled glucose receptor regulating Gpa2-domain-containing protein [Chaetomium globosum]